VPTFQAVEKPPLTELRQQVYTSTAALQNWIANFVAEKIERFQISLPANWVELVEWVEERQETLKAGADPTTGLLKWEDFAQELVDERKMFRSHNDL
jgi:hypothetical protein